MNSARIKIKDLQFPRYFLQNEIEVPRNVVDEILLKEVEIKNYGEPDTVIDRGNSIVYHNPTSLTRFLFNTLYSVLSPHIQKDIHKDKLGLGLLFTCKEYVYQNYDKCVHTFSGPPVFVNLNKLPVVSFIVRELIEPLTGSIYDQDIPIFFIKCNFTDATRIMPDMSHMVKQYGLPLVYHNDFPCILANASMYNEAAVDAHLLFKVLVMCMGEEKACRILQRVLTEKNSNLMSNLVLIIKNLRGDPSFLVDFLKYLSSNISFSSDQKNDIDAIFHEAVNKNSYFHDSIKTAQTSQIFRQWSQWALLMGLIEKQLGPMRGSMWPASETIKPHEDALRQRQKEIAESRNKIQLNFEELLESYRDTFKHKSIEPGKLIEVMLKDNRVWK